jgi:hypothetical protein
LSLQIFAAIAPRGLVGRLENRAVWKLRDLGMVRLICPTCQNVFAGAIEARIARLLCMGLFSIFWWSWLAEPWLAAPVRLRPAGFGETAFARFAWYLWHGLA